MTTPILLFEKNDDIRTSLGDWLELVFPEQSIIYARDSGEAVRLTAEGEPCAILVDIDPLGVDGIRTVGRLRDAAPSAKIIVLAMDDYRVLYRAAMAAGADICVRTWQIGEELLPVLRDILGPDGHPGEPKTVLCIEDEVEMIELIKLTLERGPFRVFSALSGQQGLNLARAVRPDVVLLDLMMPGMDGMEVYRQLKADEKLRDVPIIVVSVVQPTSARARGLEVDDYVTKPFVLRDFRRRVAQVVARRRVRVRERR